MTATFISSGGGGYSKAQGLGEYEDWDDEKVAIEIEKQRAEARVIAIQNELQANEIKFKREIE